MKTIVKEKIESGDKYGSTKSKIDETTGRRKGGWWWGAMVDRGEGVRRRVAVGDAKSFRLHSRRKIEAGRQCVAHQRSIRFRFSRSILVCLRLERNEHARGEPCCWTLVEPRFPSNRVDGNPVKCQFSKRCTCALPSELVSLSIYTWTLCSCRSIRSGRRRHGWRAGSTKMSRVFERQVQRQGGNLMESEKKVTMGDFCRT